MVYLHANKPPILHRDLSSYNILVSTAPREAFEADKAIIAIFVNKPARREYDNQGSRLWLVPCQAGHWRQKVCCWANPLDGTRGYVTKIFYQPEMHCNSPVHRTTVLRDELNY